MAKVEIENFVLNTGDGALLLVDVQSFEITSEEVTESVDAGGDILLAKAGTNLSEAAESLGLPVIDQSYLTAAGPVSMLGPLVVADFNREWELEDVIAIQTKQVLDGAQLIVTSPEHVQVSRRLIDFLTVTKSYCD